MAEIDFSEMDSGLQRPLISWRKKGKAEYLRLGRKWGVLFQRYRELIPATVGPKLDEVVAVLPVDVCETCFVANLKAVSRYVLADITEHGLNDYVYALDLHVLGGYDTELNRVDPLATVEAEFCTPSETKLDADMKKAILDTVGLMKFGVVRGSFAEFVKFRDAWANPGASTYGKTARIRAYVRKKGKMSYKELTLRNKWFKALVATDEQLTRDCLAGKPAIVKPFRKLDEPAKSRTVQCFDTRSLIRSAYLCEGIKEYNGSKIWTTLESSSRDKMRLRRRLLRKDGDFRLCTDQSSFDINQSKESVMFTLEALFSKIVKYGKNRDLKRVAEAELEALRHAYLVGGSAWRKGVLSGMKFTALVDTVLNRAASVLVLQRLGVGIKFGLFQGDDAVMITDRDVDKEAVAAEYRILGLEVNPDKSWKARNRCEFLHEIYSDGVIRGFPARIAKSLLWKKPNTGPSVGGATSIQEDISTLQTAARRGLVGVVELGWRLLRRVGYSGGRDQFIESWFTPGALGGLGFGSKGRVRFEILTAKRRHTSVELVSPSVYLADDKQLRRAAVAQRAAGAVSLPGFVTSVRMSRIRLPPALPPRISYPASQVPRVRLNWTWRDSVPDPYLKKLRLEYKLAGRVAVTREDVPTRVLDQVGDYDRTIRWYNRMIRQTVTILDGVRYHEPYSGIARWGDWVWAGIVGLAATGSMRRGEVQGLFEQLVSATWSMVLWYKPVLQYEV